MLLANKHLSKYPLVENKVLQSWYSGGKRVTSVTLGLKGSSGRNSSGRIVVHSKGSVRKKIVYNILSSTLAVFRRLSFLAQIRFDVTKNGIVGLFHNSLGCWFNTLLPTDFFLFDFIRIYKDINLTKHSDINLDYWFYKWPRVLYDMPYHSKICSIEIILNFSKKSCGVKLARAAGSRALLLDNKYYKNWSIVILPSFVIKILPSSSAAFLNYIENQLFGHTKSKKAGYYKKYGKKPTVRGIVKNPCDHPNGGRTRTILLSRTPWGKIAKKSRHKNIFKSLKVISKRLTRKDRGLSKKFFVNIFNEENLIVKFFSNSWMEDKKNINTKS